MGKHLVSCARCGKIHPYGECPMPKPSYNPHTRQGLTYSQWRSEARAFRDTVAWRKVSIAIRKRDKYLCKLCLHNGIINNRDLTVHHIIPITENKDLCMDGSNLITLCRQCHELVEHDVSYRRLLATLVDTPAILSLKK